MADKAFLTPKILKWARESSKISLEDAAKKVNVSPERLEAWENGADYPTIRQASMLAKFYRRPFSLFFLPDIPLDFQPLQDFRSDDSIDLDTASLFIIREIQQKQSWISDLYEETGEEALPFIGKFSLDNNPEEVAIDILKALNINPEYYEKDPIKEWIEKAERAGIFVSRTSFIHSKLIIDKDVIQGFAIADKYAPFVFVNSQNWDAPQLFTLVHELAHIWIAKSGISNEIEIDIVGDRKSKYHPVELFCNVVAANALMPVNLMMSIPSDVFDSQRSVFRIVKTLGVSSFAFLYRSLNLGLIDLNSYRELKKDAEEAFNEFVLREQEKKRKRKEEEKVGGPSPYLLKLNKNSRLFTRVVMDSYKSGILPPSIASNLLNTKINKFSKFETYMT
ncbi:XRE family transcriptional regulator [Poritiphilus flavus]|uniref:Helix-turn-helix domain-containing protein n=1 Tax=Poritiphilus flavus TaxID=2697053 RepID=A0A6L9EIE3_9FLAO|nr:XRE family transcriptional regulator [Poritiphilus flavus]NAS14436.1 helix-turn-helix domain-containing protein [Poritiphilus flavus]